MLPVLIFDHDHNVRSEMLSFLNEYSRRSGERFSVLENARTADEAALCLRTTDGILLMMVGVGSGRDAGRIAVGLERLAAGRNRDSYTLYWISDMEQLPAVASECLRPVGFILPPANQAQFDAIMGRISADYAALVQSPADHFLPLQSGGTVHRLAVSSISYIEALDKKLNIWTNSQCITVYEKLTHMENILGDRFFRCHRSYLVNYSAIERVDYAAMTLTLTGGILLPLSRSSKNLLKERMDKEGLDNGG